MTFVDTTYLQTENKKDHILDFFQKEYLTQIILNISSNIFLIFFYPFKKQKNILANPFLNLFSKTISTLFFHIFHIFASFETFFNLRFLH